MVKIATLISFFFLGLSVLFLEEKSKKISLNSLEPNFRAEALDLKKNGDGDLGLDTIKDSRTLLMDSVLNYICLSKIVQKDIVMKQVIWETGWLKGEFLMSRNNLFGFRYKEYLRFSNWKESVDYYEKWQAKYYTNPEENYFDFLVRIRYSNSRYPGHLKSIKYSKTCADL
jgi:hypothetical protein